jgi:uncharacterized protein with GYD domain
MPTYVMLTRVSGDALREPASLEELGLRVTEKLHADCPEVKWLASYAVLGGYDYVDVFEAPDNEVATKVAVVVRSFGHATTETWPATPWERFKQLLRPAAAGGGRGSVHQKAKGSGSLTQRPQR